MTFKELKKRYSFQKQQQQEQEEQLSSSGLALLSNRLRNKPFWIWNIEKHRQVHKITKGNCCFNHIIGCPEKNGTPKPMFDYEEIIFNEKEPENTCIYKRLILDYTYGLDRIYTQEEIDQAKASPSFEREYNCKYLGQIGNVFHTKDIDLAVEKGDQYPYPTPEDISFGTKKVMGIDCGYGSSNFAIVILEHIDGLVRVLFSEEYSKPDFNAMLYKVGELLGEYRNIDKVYIDASVVSFIRAIKLHTGEDEYYDEIISDYRAKKWDWESTMLFVPVSFGVEHKTMLGNVKIFLEKGHLAIHPKFDKLITSLRTATEKGEGILAYDDTFDALRLALKFFFYKEEDKAVMRAAMINSFEMDRRFS